MLITKIMSYFPSQTDDITAIRDSFILDGVSWEIDANMKLRHLWKKLQRTEDALKRYHLNTFQS